MSHSLLSDIRKTHGEVTSQRRGMYNLATNVLLSEFNVHFQAKINVGCADINKTRESHIQCLRS